MSIKELLEGLSLGKAPVTSPPFTINDITEVLETIAKMVQSVVGNSRRR